MSEKRPRVRIRFKYNLDTGEVEEFIIDDNAPAASEAYHDKVAEAISSRLARQPEIEDAGPMRLPRIEPKPVVEDPLKVKEKEKKPLEESAGNG